MFTEGFPRPEEQGRLFSGDTNSHGLGTPLDAPLLTSKGNCVSQMSPAGTCGPGSSHRSIWLDPNSVVFVVYFELVDNIFKIWKTANIKRQASSFS